MEEINIEELLTKKIVIPEIQREYVWGNNEDVVSQFLKDLNKKIKDQKNKINIGFLYTYNKGKENYLIDGQQRFTTIFLLLVYLYKSNKIAISSESSDFNNFGFRVRPLTEQFVAALLKNDITDFSDLENEKWFVSDYSRDTSIKAICNLFKIFKNLNLSFTKEDIEEKIYFWYFNVNNTSEGEELYITMNSRGEQLIDSEQIKPRLFNKIDNNVEKKKFGKKWDDWEEYFFRNRPNAENVNYIKNVDYTLNNIIKICLELRTYEIHNDIDPINDDISLTEIDEIMEIFFNNIFYKEIKEVGLFEILYQESRKGVLNKLYCLETYIIAWKTYQCFNSEANDLIYVINNAVNYGYINQTNFLRFLGDFVNRKDKNLSVFDFILEEYKNGEDKLNNVLKGKTDFILPKIKAIKNNILGTETRTKITEAENFAFFKGQIHFLYNDQNEIDADTFKIRFENCIKYFDKTGFVDDDIAINFMQALYHLWSLKQEVYIFDYEDVEKLRNNIIASPSLRKLIGQILSAEKLTDIKQCDIDTADENIKEAWLNFIKIANSKEAIKFILTQEKLKGSRVRWNDGFAIYQRYSKNNGVIYLSKTRRDFLLRNTPGINIESEKDIQNQLKETGLLIGWDITFSYKDMKFSYKSNNTVYIYDVNKKLKKLFKVDSANYTLDEKGINNFEEELKKYSTV